MDEGFKNIVDLCLKIFVSTFISKIVLVNFYITLFLISLFTLQKDL